MALDDERKARSNRIPEPAFVAGVPGIPRRLFPFAGTDESTPAAM